MPNTSFIMPELIECQMLVHVKIVLRILSNKTRDIEVGVYSMGKCEKICLDNDVDSMGEVSLTPNTFLKCGRSSSSAVDLYVKETHDQ